MFVDRAGGLSLEERRSGLLLLHFSFLTSALAKTIEANGEKGQVGSKQGEDLQGSVLRGEGAAKVARVLQQELRNPGASISSRARRDVFRDPEESIAA